MGKFLVGKKSCSGMLPEELVDIPSQAIKSFHVFGSERVEQEVFRFDEYRLGHVALEI